MKLQLVNFKCLRDVTFNISSNYCLISGQSGSGKTSIFMAIQFALTGEGRKITTYGCKSCKVVLTIDDIVITRTKGPCRLLVNSQDVMYEDKEAQSVIDVKFKHFMMGYVSQRVYKSFLATSQAEKLSILENIAFSDLNVQKIQNKCKDLVSERKGLVLKYSTEINTILNVLKDLGVENVTDVDLDVEIDKEIDRMTIQYENYKKLIELRKECRFLVYDMMKLHDVKVVDKAYVNSILVHKSNYDRYISVKMEMDKLSLKDDVDDIVIEEFKEIIRLNPHRNALGKFQQEYSHLIEFRNNHGVISKCPSCNSTICIRGNVVSLNDNVKEISHQKIQECNDRISIVEMQLESSKANVARLDELQKNYDEGLNYEKELQTMIQNRKYNQEYNLKLEQSKILQCDPPTEDVDVLLKNVDLYSRLIQQQNRLNKLNTEIEHLLTTCDENVDYSSSLERLQTIKKQQLYQLQFDKVQNLREKESKLDMQLPSAVKLLSLVKTAESLALESVISLINERTNLYLGIFCENITANISLEGGKINIIITINDNETDVASVSGGEYARIVLAFAVAMAEITNAPILMLDEILSSLDADISNVVLEALKSNYHGCIMIIAHQTTTGGFDQVVHL